MSKKIKIVLGSLFVIILLIGGIGGYLYIKWEKDYEEGINRSLSDENVMVDFIINQGETASTIAENLMSAGILDEREKLYFISYLKESGAGPLLQAGEYKVNKAISIVELTELLQKSQKKGVWVLIKEGLRVSEIASIIEKTLYDINSNTKFDGAEFMRLANDKAFINTKLKEYNINFEDKAEVDNLEGLLFPDKYQVDVDIDAEGFMEVMLLNFRNKTQDLDISYRTLIMASILEREGRTYEERQMITSVIEKRLRDGWYLGLCATVLYAMDDWTHELTYSDLKIDSPYNTYNRLGLPPTPISAPGISSINAALNPIDNQYYFYLHEPNGTIHYAVTEAEHERNKAKYL